jgi:S-layer glycoprotein
MFKGSKVFGLLLALALSLVAVQAAAAQASTPTGSLTASDQALTNNAVLITSVTASQNGWVVVHESNADGTVKVPDNIGKMAVKAGTTTNLSIPLDKQVANGAKLWPMLHIDVGQPGVYEFPGADVPVAANGEIVMVPVVVSVPAAQPTAPPATAPAAPTGRMAATDQLLVNNTVIVASVTASQDGWVAVHESNPDGTVKAPANIGKVAVKAGTTTNLAIPLDKQVANGAKLWPMLHIDVGQPGVYEFPGPDVPVAVNGEVVMVPIFVNVTPSGVNPGMPTTGQSDGPLFGLILLGALGLLSLGWVARRRAGSVR